MEKSGPGMLMPVSSGWPVKMYHTTCYPAFTVEHHSEWIRHYLHKRYLGGQARKDLWYWNHSIRRGRSTAVRENG
ncbi:hypothetical protein JD936_004193 [Salmonella enterica]|nr:hypothetical protein [Salmonella enterica subsp. enterica serovar Infantis]EGT6055331.1 hypothetical protein [Salmonella enterica]